MVKASLRILGLAAVALLGVVVVIVVASWVYFEPNSRPRDEAKTIRVAIRKDGQVYLNDIKQKDPNELTPQIKERLEDLPEGQRTVYLKADTDLAYSEVMKVMDLIREAGVEDLALIAENRVQGQGS